MFRNNYKERAKLTSFVTVDANARVNPARLASILGFISATTAVIPTTALLRRSNRVESHRFTEENSSS